MMLTDHSKILNNGEFQSLFDLTGIQINNTKSSINFLLEELEKTRFHFDSLEISFYTLGELHGLSLNQLKDYWDIVKNSVINFPRGEPDYKRIESDLTKNNVTGEQNSQILLVTKKLIQISRRTLNSNISAHIQSPQKKLGIMGELLPYLHERDIQKSNCIFHKLIPDNRIMPRHGMDLLSVKFGKVPNEDLVQFLEAKGTINNFDDRCNEIVKWFNGDIESHISMVIEGARIEWKSKLDYEIFRRASAALSRFQADVKNFKFIGSILCDFDNLPTNDKICKFNGITVEKGNKHLILFSIKNLQQLVDEVFKKACKI